MRSLDEVVDLLLVTGDAEAKLDTGFPDSAIATAELIDVGGVSAVAIAQEVRARVDAGDLDPRGQYTSDVAVGYHANVGRYLQLPGEEPKIDGESVKPREIQTMIKIVRQHESRAIINAAKDKESAYTLLVSACAARGKSSSTPEARAARKSRSPRRKRSFSTLVLKAIPLLERAKDLGIETAEDVQALEELIKRVEQLNAQLLRARLSKSAA